MPASLMFLFLLGTFEGVQLESVCEKEITGENVAKGGKASQSSKLSVYDNSQTAIDGNRSAIYWAGSCSHTQSEMSPWWKVDLLELHRITSVVVVNRGDCCPERLWGAEVRIGNSPDNCNPVCDTITSDIVIDNVATFCCCGMEGRYVSVVIPGRMEYLTLCEVELYAAVPTNDNLPGCW